MRYFSLFFFLLSIMVLPTKAFSFFVELQFSPIYQQSEEAYFNTNKSGYFANLNLGTTLHSSFRLAVRTLNIKTIEKGSAAEEISTRITALGTSLGFVLLDSFVFDFAYYYSPQKEEVSSHNIQYSQGMGLVLDLGYAFKLGTWSIGPKLSYYQLSYGKRKTNEVLTDLEKNRQEAFVQSTLSINKDL